MAAMAWPELGTGRGVAGDLCRAVEVVVRDGGGARDRPYGDERAERHHLGAVTIHAGLAAHVESRNVARHRAEARLGLQLHAVHTAEGVEVVHLERAQEDPSLTVRRCIDVGCGAYNGEVDEIRVSVGLAWSLRKACAPLLQRHPLQWGSGEER
jgi:hypothetical protein